MWGHVSYAKGEGVTVSQVISLEIVAEDEGVNDI